MIFDSLGSPGITNTDPFNNVIFASGNNFAGTLVVQGALALNGRTLNDGLIDVKGDMTVAAAFLGGSGSIRFSGTGDQIFTNNGGANVHRTWTVNKPSGAVTLASDLDLTDPGGTGSNLNLTNGTITTGNFTVSAGRRNVVRNAGDTGYINGKLRRDFNSTGSRTFHVGAPVPQGPFTLAPGATQNFTVTFATACPFTGTKLLRIKGTSTNAGSWGSTSGVTSP